MKAKRSSLAWSHVIANRMKARTHSCRNLIQSLTVTHDRHTRIPSGPLWITVEWHWVGRKKSGALTGDLKECEQFYRVWYCQSSFLLSSSVPCQHYWRLPGSHVARHLSLLPFNFAGSVNISNGYPGGDLTWIRVTRGQLLVVFGRVVCER